MATINLGYASARKSYRKTVTANPARPVGSNISCWVWHQRVLSTLTGAGIPVGMVSRHTALAVLNAAQAACFAGGDGACRRIFVS